ncbi:hypothetical protein MMC10_003234 [Thelotrema lepadinum]|nr:hypothetical protein [Thelotrema lepadinum]
MSLYPFLQEIAFDEQASKLLEDLKSSDFKSVLKSQYATSLLGLDRENVFSDGREIYTSWTEWLKSILATRLDQASRNTREEKQQLLLVGLAALYSFLQANVTGPPLEWDSKESCFAKHYRAHHQEVRRALIAELSVDGEAAYRLTSHVELFSLARTILNHPLFYVQETAFVWARLRVNFLHQQLLNEVSFSLQSTIYQDISFLDSSVLGSASVYEANVKVLYLLERAAINTYHGLDKKAREDLSQATNLRDFEYVLTGRLGKRTKFQQDDISQLVVLARSKTVRESDSGRQDVSAQESTITENLKPQNLDLNDDTLLESIKFTEQGEAADPGVKEEIPAALADLDTSNQPILDPLDSIILLSVASSITNTSPQHGLTREETLPYATRVLDSGSTNWQIYTQALLVRSRIEGYRSRTVERGVLQMQAVVDQIIAETKGTANGEVTSKDAATTFLPRPKESESATATERLLFIYQLGAPLTWSLESELATRWVGLGALRTALEIFERLEMWAEAALCWAATDREDKANQIVRSQLYRKVENTANLEDIEKAGEVLLNEEASPLPNDAPRLFCILGDIEKEPRYYERAWEVSNQRFARAQRSLGKRYLAARDLPKADEAYSKSLAINPQNGAAWFSLGCIRLERMDWSGAVDAFTRSVQIEEDDAEAWSNLAAALLRLPAEHENEALDNDGDDDKPFSSKVDPQKHRKEAFVAFKKATSLKRDSYRIWQNLLNVAATMSPPPFSDIIIAQQRLIELQSKTEGESCVDVEVLEGVLSHIITSGSSQPTREESTVTEPPRKRFGLENMFSELVNKHIVPLITHSRRLWQLVARLAIHQNKPSSALDAYEKAWRATLNKPGWDDGSGSSSSPGSATPDSAWGEVVDSTVELVDAYESLGEKKVNEGLAAGSGELVCKTWKYKARMAIKSVVGRRTKAGFEDVQRLNEKMETLRS